MRKDSYIGAVIQAGSVGFNTSKTLEKMEDLASEAAKTGAEIAVFPEAFIGGYPKGISFGATVGNRTHEGRDEFAEYFGGSIEIPGPEFEKIARAARINRLFMVIGVIERELGTLYCTVLFFNKNGDYLGKHRKLMPTASERTIWGFGDGSTLPVYKTEFGNIGSVICWENYMPMLRMAMYSKGIEIYCAPTADGRKTWLPTVQMIGLEGRCFVLSCNQFLQRKVLPDWFKFEPGINPDSILMNGGSCIISPLGEVLAGPIFNKEIILTAEINASLIMKGKYDFDVAGHYSRPDVFKLQIDESRKRSTETKK